MRGAILRNMNSYLGREIPAGQLVLWAQDTLRAGGLSPDDALAPGPGGPRREPATSLWPHPGGLRQFLRRLGQELRVSTGQRWRADDRGRDAGSLATRHLMELERLSPEVKSRPTCCSRTPSW
jgi:hypothetical protein